jgi:hypothetical protein
VDEWAALGESLKDCVGLVEILDFGWSKSVLAHGISSVDLDKRDIGDIDATVLSALLSRMASSLTELLLG